MDWAVPQWWILFLGACASFVLSLVNIAWTWKQARRMDQEIRKKTQQDAAARVLIDELADFQNSYDRLPNEFVGLRRNQWEAAALAESWGAVKTRWKAGTMLARVTHLNEPKT